MLSGAFEARGIVVGGGRVSADATSGGEAAGVLQFIESVEGGPISNVVEIAGESVEVISTARGSGEIGLLVRRSGEVPYEVARLSVRSGEVVLNGAYTREVRSFFDLMGWRHPTTFIIDKAAASLPADDYLIQELKNYFGQKFGPQKAYTSRTKFVFADGEAEGLFLRRVRTFFGEGMGVHSEFAGRWNSPDGPFGEVLGERQMCTDSMQLRRFAQRPPAPLKPLPPPPADGGISMRTIGLAAPGSREAQTSHRLLYADSKVVAIEMPSYAYREGVDAIAISHSHADHMNPHAVLEQFRVNEALGRRGLLLVGADCEAAVVDGLAAADGWVPSSGVSARDFLKGRYSFETARHFRAGNVTVDMMNSSHGAHGVPNSGVLVSEGGKPLYFYSGDGDFNPASLRKQLDEVLRVREARLGTSDRGGNEPLLRKYAGVSDTDLEAQARRLEGMLRQLGETPYVDVDQGTTGFDTHGNSSTVDAIREERLRAKFGDNTAVRQILDDSAKKARLFELAKGGDGTALCEYLKANGLGGEGSVVAEEIAADMLAVRPTHNLGYGPQADIPEINEGRVDLLKGGARMSVLPKLSEELTQMGAPLAVKGEPVIVVRLGETEVRLKNCARSRGAIKGLMERYSTTSPKGEPIFGLSEVNVDGKPAVSWLEGRGLKPTARSAPPPARPVPEKPATYMGLSTETPPWVQKLGGRAKALYEMSVEALKHAEEMGLPTRLAEWLRDAVNSPSLFAKISAAIEGSPKLAALLSRASSVFKAVGSKAGKAFGPAFIALLVGYEAYARGDKLIEGDASAWSETAGDFSGAAAGLAGFVIDAPFTGAYYLTRVVANGFDLGAAWDDTGVVAFPIARSVQWGVTRSLKWFHGVK